MANQKNTHENEQKLAKKLNFKTKDTPVLIQALTHPAYFEGSRPAGESDNQRLEFLGDAVLDLLVGYYLYQHYPEAQEGELTKMRAATVCESFLANMAEELGINQALRLGKGSEAGGDRSRPSILADAFEAVLGAIFVTQGFNGASAFVEKYFGEALRTLSKDDYEDKKSLLQETVQRIVSGNVSYRLIGASGPDHAKIFMSGAYFHKLLLGEGKGSSKKESEQEAAKDALNRKDSWLSGLISADKPKEKPIETLKIEESPPKTGPKKPKTQKEGVSVKKSKAPNKPKLEKENLEGEVLAAKTNRKATASATPKNTPKKTGQAPPKPKQSKKAKS